MKIIKTVALLSFIAFGFFASAQENRTADRKERSQVIEEMKRDFIKERLNLSEEKTAEMMALMEEYDQKKKEIRKNAHTKRSDTALSEVEANLMLAKKMETKEKMLNLEREYMQKSIEKFSAIQVLAYYKAEKEFKKELLKMLEEKKHGRREH